MSTAKQSVVLPSTSTVIRFRLRVVLDVDAAKQKLRGGPFWRLKLEKKGATQVGAPPAHKACNRLAIAHAFVWKSRSALENTFTQWIGNGPLEMHQ